MTLEQKPKRFAFFKGCMISSLLRQYGTATGMVLKPFGIDLVELPFNCCGYPVRDIDESAYLYAAVRNIALAQQRNLDILTPCKCCFGSLITADHIMRSDERIQVRINEKLADEGLSWKGEVEILHLLKVLDRDVGVSRIREKVVRGPATLKVAPHYGCHALRPASVTGFDNPSNPTLFEGLIRALGARAVDWPMRLDCCGRPLKDKNRALSEKFAMAKLADAARAGAGWICTACSYCQVQFEQVVKKNGHKSWPQPILYPQLLGLAMDLDPADLGLDPGRAAILLGD